MSKNKYKNNESMNQTDKQPLVSEEQGLNDGRDRSLKGTEAGPSESFDEEEPVVLSQWMNPAKEEPIKETIHPELYQIPIDYKDHVKLAPTKPFDVTAGRYPDADPHDKPKNREYLPNNELFHDDGSEELESMEGRYYSEPLNPYTGEKASVRDQTVEKKEPLDRRPHRPQMRVNSAKPKGFPWWWILLPLILLALIYGLTRPPAAPKTPSTSTTSFAPEINHLMASQWNLGSMVVTMG